MATKKDLQNYIDSLNRKYCKHTKNHLEINSAYGGYQVVLTGKPLKRKWYQLMPSDDGKRFIKVPRTKYAKGSLGGAEHEIGNHYHSSANETIRGLSDAEDRGWIKSAIRHYEPKRKRRY